MSVYDFAPLAPASEGASGHGDSSREPASSAEERDAPRPGCIDADLAAADAPGDRKPGENLHQRQDKLVDEAVEETFPASDPIAPKRITK